MKKMFTIITICSIYFFLLSTNIFSQEKNSRKENEMNEVTKKIVLTNDEYVFKLKQLTSEIKPLLQKKEKLVKEFEDNEKKIKEKTNEIQDILFNQEKSE